MSDEVTRLQQRVEELEAALRAIVKHQRHIGGDMAPYSITLIAAEAALKRGETAAKECRKCDNPSYRSHRCPFASEIHGDNNPKYCNCCSDCTRECLMNI